MLDAIIYDLDCLADRLIRDNYEAEAGHELKQLAKSLTGIQATLRSLVGGCPVRLPYPDVHVAVSPEAVDDVLAKPDVR